MLSYLHAFHAGNHADILKHAALIQLLKKLNQKSAPYSFFDTHAGSGLYSTQGEKARKTGEAARGVLALAEYTAKEAAQGVDGGGPNLGLATDTGSSPKSGADQEALQDLDGGGPNSSLATDTGSSLKSGGSLPAALLDYLNFVRPYLARDLYPGSPLIERAFLRPGDAHTICELHPAEFEALRENCSRDFGLSTDTASRPKSAAASSGLATDTGSRPKSGADQEALQVQNGGGQQETDASLKSGGALPAALLDYLNFVRPYLARDLYPGSPLIERAFLRPSDAHTICELHPAEYEALKENCARDFGLRSAFGPDQEGAAPNAGPSAVPHTQILKADGFKTLLAQTPPKIKRGAVLIDPSYEEAADYEAVKKTVIAVHKKWSAGIIMVWYPLLAHRAAEIEKMIESICAAAKIQNANTNILRADFCVDTAQSHTEMPLKENAAVKAAALSSKTGLSSAAPRLYGSGILVINAPWKLDQELDEALKHLSRVSGLATEPSYTVELL